jgi:hypothetical protein
MRALLGVLSAIAIVVAIEVLATSRLHDRELLTPPPEAVAEGFYREIVAHRFDRAVTYLSDSESTSVEELRQLGASIERRLGRVHDVKAVTVDQTDTEALVTTRLKSETASDAISSHLRFSSGGWKLVQSANAGSR